MATMSETIRGIILDNRDYKDNDAMIKVLTRDHGLLTFIAKGTKRTNSKNAMALLPYSVSDITFDFKETKDIFILYKAELIDHFYKDDIVILSALSLLVKLTLSAYDKELAPLLYDELYAALLNSKRYDMRLVVALYMTFIVRLLGFEAYIDGCVECDNKKVVGFSSLRGGFLCAAHLGDDRPIDVKTLRALRYIFKASQNDIAILNDLDLTQDVYRLVIEHVICHTDIEKKALDFYWQMTSPSELLIHK